jgi:peptide/nickel transport system substrate-binding protein
MPNRSSFTRVARPCRHPQVEGLTVMVNSIYNGYRYEDLWLDN